MDQMLYKRVAKSKTFYKSADGRLGLLEFKSTTQEMRLPNTAPSRQPKQKKRSGSQATFALAAIFFAHVAWNFFRRAALPLEAHNTTGSIYRGRPLPTHVLRLLHWRR